MTDIEEHFAGNGDDGSTRPTKNRVPNLAPLRFCWYFNNNDSRFTASRILKFNMEITVRFSFYNNCAARESVPLVFSSGAQTALNNR